MKTRIKIAGLLLFLFIEQIAFGQENEERKLLKKTLMQYN
tara:strand:+ start:1064 stop:1183 length:120 start_codon:yes stop_codon:yes gene_type:complete